MKAIKLLIRAVFLISLCFLVGCSSYSTIAPQNMGENGFDPNHFNGILYFLPCGLIHVVGGPKQATPSGNTGLTGTPKDPQNPQPDKSTDTGVTNLSSAYTVTMTQIIEPDPDQRYFLKPDRNYLYDDQVDVKVDDNGLLSSGKAVAKDQTAEIISLATSLAETAAGGGINANEAPFDAKKAISKIKTAGQLEKLFSAFDRGSFPIGLITTLQKDLASISPKDKDALETVVKTLTDAKNPISPSDVASFFGQYPDDADISSTSAPTDAIKFIQRTVEDLRDLLSALPKTAILPKEGFLKAIDTSQVQVPAGSSQGQNDFQETLTDVVSIGQIQVFLDYYPAEEYLNRDGYDQLKQLLATATNRLLPFDVTFDPSKQDEVKRVNEAISHACGFTLVVTKENSKRDITIGEHSLPVIDNEKHMDGIAFRPSVAYLVQFQWDNSTQPVPDCRKVFVLPDEAETFLIDYSRMPLVEKSTSIGFTNGMLTEFSQNLPSPIVGAFGIPKAILQALIPLPTSSGKSSGTSTNP